MSKEIFDHLCPRWDKRAETEFYHDSILSAKIKGPNISPHEPSMIQECPQSLSFRNPLSFSPTASAKILCRQLKKISYFQVEPKSNVGNNWRVLDTSFNGE